MTNPLISIITVVYNAQSTLEATIQSVVNQQKGLFEYWIIDGGSTDGSLDIIRRHEHELAGWISEPDTGIYDAMNKGVDRASGDWLFFLGADDTLTEGILEKVAPLLADKLTAVYGKVIYDNGYEYLSRINSWTLLENTLHHQSAFYHRRLFDGFRYDTHYKINGDYELTLKIYLEKHQSVYVPYIISVCGSTGASSTLSSKETNSLRGKYIKNRALNGLLSKLLDTYYLYFRTRVNLKRQLIKLIK
ncbi:glycosyltransferase family 2 protein [Spirosoma flavus]